MSWQFRSGLLTVGLGLALTCCSPAFAAYNGTADATPVKGALSLGDNTNVDQLRASAGSGDAAAQASLGTAYRYGSYGVAKDDKLAILWWRKSAESGNTAGQLMLGIAYHVGIGVERNDAEAIKWWAIAAAGEDFNAARPAMLMLGDAYSSGEGTLKDQTVATLWRKRAGNPQWWGKQNGRGGKFE